MCPITMVAWTFIAWRHSLMVSLGVTCTVVCTYGCDDGTCIGVSQKHRCAQPWDGILHMGASKHPCAPMRSCHH